MIYISLNFLMLYSNYIYYIFNNVTIEIEFITHKL